MKLQTKRLITVSTGASKISNRKNSGELTARGKPPDRLTPPLLAITNCQKNVNISPIEPASSPKAKGSRNPPPTGMAP
jgi:hypothetical protein